MKWLCNIVVLGMLEIEDQNRAYPAWHLMELRGCSIIMSNPLPLCYKDPFLSYFLCYSKSLFSCTFNHPWMCPMYCDWYHGLCLKGATHSGCHSLTCIQLNRQKQTCLQQWSAAICSSLDSLKLSAVVLTTYNCLGSLLTVCNCHESM